MRAHLVAFFIALQHRYSTRTYRITRIGAAHRLPSNSAALAATAESEVHTAATAAVGANFRERAQRSCNCTLRREEMVFFVCEDCNETLKRLKVAQHLCRCSCSAITCVDCGATFHDDSYLQHATCMSEAERYEGNLYKAPKKKERAGRVGGARAVGVRRLARTRRPPRPSCCRASKASRTSRGTRRSSATWVKNSLNLRGGDAAAVDALWAYLVARRDAARAEAAPARPGACASRCAAGREEKEEPAEDDAAASRDDETPEERKARKLRKKAKKAKKKGCGRLCTTCVRHAKTASRRRSAG